MNNIKLTAVLTLALIGGFSTAQADTDTSSMFRDNPFWVYVDAASGYQMQTDIKWTPELVATLKLQEQSCADAKSIVFKGVFTDHKSMDSLKSEQDMAVAKCYGLGKLRESANQWGKSLKSNNFIRQTEKSSINHGGMGNGEWKVQNVPTINNNLKTYYLFQDKGSWSFSNSADIKNENVEAIQVDYLKKIIFLATPEAPNLRIQMAAKLATLTHQECWKGLLGTNNRQKDGYSLCSSSFSKDVTTAYERTIGSLNLLTGTVTYWLSVDQEKLFEAVKSSGVISEFEQDAADFKIKSDAARENADSTQASNAERMQAEMQNRELKKRSNQPLVKTSGQKICLNSEGSSKVYSGYIILGTPYYNNEARTFMLTGTTEQVARDRILVRVGSITSKGRDGKLEYVNQLNGDPTYQVNQSSWDDPTSWDICR